MKNDPIKTMIEKVYELGYKDELDTFASECVELGIQYGVFGKRMILRTVCTGVICGITAIVLDHLLNKVTSKQ